MNCAMAMQNVCVISYFNVFLYFNYFKNYIPKAVREVSRSDAAS